MSELSGRGQQDDLLPAPRPRARQIALALIVIGCLLAARSGSGI